MKLNEKEALRYLGFRGKPADADTDEMIREIGGEMLRTLMPKCVYKRYDIKVLENAVELDGWRIESIKLSRHLRGCKAARKRSFLLALHGRAENPALSCFQYSIIKADLQFAFQLFHFVQKRFSLPR